MTRTGVAGLQRFYIGEHVTTCVPLSMHCVHEDLCLLRHIVNRKGLYAGNLDLPATRKHGRCHVNDRLSGNHKATILTLKPVT